MRTNRVFLLLLGLVLSLSVQAQRFFNLTSDEVSVDTVLPRFAYSVPLDGAFQDSVYEASILYPEFIDMTSTDLANYQKLSSDTLPYLPAIETRIVLDRKKGALEVEFLPLVYRDDKYQILVSFMLRVDSYAKASATSQAKSSASSVTRATTAASRYADHSVLALGNWAKIRVPSTGVYRLTESLIKQAGFTDLSKVQVYGYGGNLLNEVLEEEDIIEKDDLKPVDIALVNGKRLFYGRGPVSWSSNTVAKRTRNPYSDYGYYFITQTDSDVETIDSAAFVSTFYPSADYYHTLYEVDGYSWYEGGRNLFDTETIANGSSKTILLTNPTSATSGRLSVNITAGTASTATVSVNGEQQGTLSVSLGSYDKGSERSATYTLSDLHAADTVSIAVTSGGPVRLDYVSMAYDSIAPAPRLSAVTDEPTYVYNITNQDHHGDNQADMVIIIPTSQKLLPAAQELADFHKERDGLRVNIVPADELYNEFSSGTPDASAYRRYLKMLYDRAETDDDMPRYLLLMGDCVWDNRLLTSECQIFDADDLLLCYESENSFNEVTCYVDDGFFCSLDDGEGGSPLRSDKPDVAVGRFPVTTADEAQVMVDKTIAYVKNENAGSWQNVLMFMGDDGNDNIHMQDINAAADDIESRYPGYLVKKVMWDAYAEETSSSGNSYPEVASIIKAQQQSGALIMDYGGHGSNVQVSHEAVLKLSDFKSFTNDNLPLWITASCDIMPFDGVSETIGEAAVLNADGGAVAFFGTTRTVYSNYNKSINMAFLRLVLSHDDDGCAMTIGEAQRQAKNLMITGGQDLTTNKLQYSLLGDPAVALCMPSLTVVVDSINGRAVDTASDITLSAGTVAHVKAHIADGDNFDGVMSATVRDALQLVTCQLNASADADEAFTYYDRLVTLYSGSDSVRAGQIDFSFAVPMDISYSDEAGIINIHAVSSDHTLLAHGSESNFIVGGTGDLSVDSLGPKIYCYLNSPEFQDGGEVNTTPYFVAQLSDDDGINAAGSGIGHDMQLIIDNDPSKTYTLNDNFSYDFGTYTSGTTYYSIPELEPGSHSLLFRAWDVMNNSSTATLNFVVVRGLAPTLYDVSASDNPAKTSTTFIVSHNFAGASMDVTIDVFDTTGRQLWTHSDTGVTDAGAYTVSWDLTTSSGTQIPTGVYLYRVRMSGNGGAVAKKAKKLVVVR